LGLKKKTLKRILTFLVAFSAGALLGGAFFHLLPESAEELTLEVASIYLVAGFCGFFVLERVLYWHHCHEGECKVHPFNYLILLGDGVHNFIDGLVIAASFLVSVPFGIVTTLLIIGHEIPQELGDFGVLVYGGFGRRKALFYNFISQLTCVLGGIVGFFVSPFIGSMHPLLALAAGGFLYISASDLIPELHKEKCTNKSLGCFAVFIVGIAFMLVIKYIAGE
jgi:zinc and cadmium transporter